MNNGSLNEFLFFAVNTLIRSNFRRSYSLIASRLLCITDRSR